MLVPVKDLDQSLDVFHEHFQVYPLWLCPMRIPAWDHHRHYQQQQQPEEENEKQCDSESNGSLRA